MFWQPYTGASLVRRGFWLAVLGVLGLPTRAGVRAIIFSGSSITSRLRFISPRED